VGCGSCIGSLPASLNRSERLVDLSLNCGVARVAFFGHA
jgi:hypothetical protein